MTTQADDPVARYRRYVAIGDSSTEGLDDPDGQGGYLGWSLRLARHLADRNGRIHYANLGLRGRRTATIRAEQFEAALALEPDLVTLFTGTNDVIARRFDAGAVRADVADMQRAFIERGATVLGFTLPDMTPVMPLAVLLARRLHALNDALRDASAASGAILVDVARYPVASDPRLWSEDRLHANALGHTRIAAALAGALGLSGPGQAWSEPLPPAPPRGLVGRFAGEVRWGARYLVPWVWRSLRGRSSGDGRRCRYPALIEIPGGERPGTP